MIATLSLAATVVISLFDLNFSSVFIILIGAVIGLTYYSITDRKERVPTEGYSQTAIITETSGDTQRFGEDEENRSNESSPDEDRAAIEERRIDNDLSSNFLEFF